MVGHYYGRKAYPKLSGMYIFLTSAIASPAGLVGGMIFDRYGSYAKSFSWTARSQSSRSWLSCSP